MQTTDIYINNTQSKHGKQGSDVIHFTAVSLRSGNNTYRILQHH